jgi:glycosyltransferase involved in cell wall biosynthesis
MKIGIDISPLENGHKVRGTGFYLHYLKESLVTYFPDNEYVFFTGKEPGDKAITVTHYPYFEPYFLTLPLVKKHRTVVTVHDLTPLVFPENFPAGYKGQAKWQVQRLSLRYASAVITDSQASKHDIVRFTGIPEERIHVVYLAAGHHFTVQPNSHREKRRLEKYNLPEKFVLYVGDATWNKNLPRLLEAVKKADVALVMVGKTLADDTVDAVNPWNSDLLITQQMAKDNPNVRMLGFVSTEELVALYNIATVTVIPSLYEGFGLPILEAMSSGCPVVTTKRGSIPEVAGEAAWYVDAYSSSSIASGIGEVFYNPRLRQSLVEKGLEQAGNFSWEKTARETLDVYEQVVYRSDNKILLAKMDKQKKFYEKEN